MQFILQNAQAGSANPVSTPNVDPFTGGGAYVPGSAPQRPSAAAVNADPFTGQCPIAGQLLCEKLLPAAGQRALCRVRGLLLLTASPSFLICDTCIACHTSQLRRHLLASS